MNTEINLGQYDLKTMLRNPGLIHSIQDNLIELKGDSLMAEAIRNGAKKNIKSCIEMIVSQAKDNYPLMERIVGKENMELINEYEGN